MGCFEVTYKQHRRNLLSYIREIKMFDGMRAPIRYWYSNFVGQLEVPQRSPEV